MTYTYYDYLENYYDYYYEYYYWPEHYNHTNMSSSFNGTYPPSPWVQPYPMDIFNPLFWGISLSCAVLSVVLFGFILHQIYQRLKAGKLRSSKASIALVVSCLLLHVAFCLVDPVSYYKWYINWTSVAEQEMVDITWDVIWCLSKISLYFVFMNRYYNIFKAATTMDAEGERKKCVMFGLFMFTIVLQMVLIAVYILFYYLWEDNEVLESKQVYLNACWAFLAVDLLLVAVICYLLNRSILKLVVFERAVNQLSIVSSRNLAPSFMTTTRELGGSRLGKPEVSRPPTPEHTPEPELHDADPAATSTHVNSDSENRASTVKSATAENSATKYNERHGRFKLLHTTTRIALTCAVSIVSTLVYQLVWNIAEEAEQYDLLWFTYTWCIDAIINMVCVYLSMGIANDRYKSVCVDTCHCHQCCLFFVMKAVSVSTDKKVRKLELSKQQELSVQIEVIKDTNK